MSPARLNSCSQSLELGRAAGPIFGFHVLIEDQNCIWEPFLVNSKCWMHLGIFFTDAVMEEPLLPCALLVGNSKKWNMLWPPRCILNVMINDN